MKKLNWLKTACTIGALAAAAAIAAPAQTFNTLVNFDGTNGSLPEDRLVQGLDGNFYGTASQGGTGQEGTAFRMTPGGLVTTLYNFCTEINCSDGCEPFAGMNQASNGNLFGIVFGCGAFGGGNIYKIAPTGALTIVYNFCAQPNCTDGAIPTSLIQASDGSLYGTTRGLSSGSGTVFRFENGVVTTLYAFCSLPNCADGQAAGGIIQANDGNFYGTTATGGPFEEGTIFKITPQGVFTSLYSFTGFEGGEPTGLVQGTNGDLFGTTGIGGSSGCRLIGCGTAFTITLSGALTTLHTFCSQARCADGSAPGPLAQANDGNFYGTTSADGPGRNGTVFELVLGRGLTTLHAFNGSDGSVPGAGVFQATSGVFYGTTSEGGTSGGGTVFTLATGLTPFVRTLPVAGTVGKNVIILGNGLTGTTSVTFNGTPAAFAIVSDSEITATVPTGAITGMVRVTLPSGALKSNVNFQVLP